MTRRKKITLIVLIAVGAAAVAFFGLSFGICSGHDFESSWAWSSAASFQRDQDNCQPLFCKVVRTGESDGNEGGGSGINIDAGYTSYACVPRFWR